MTNDSVWLKLFWPGISRQFMFSGQARHRTNRAIQARFVRISYQYVVGGRSQDVRLVNAMCH